MQIEFPPLFLWGAAISSYQTEGQNYNSDWALWEKKFNLEAAGKTTNHYNLFEKDFASAKELNLKTLRISLEWSRLCPSQNNFAQEEFSHYKNVLNSLNGLEILPIVTLHHFTNPVWFAQKDGWQNSGNVDFFLRYLKKTVEYFKHDVKYWLIFNEPLVYVYNGFVRGNWPPGIKSISQARKVLSHIVSAYKTGYQEIKNIYRQSSLACEVSFAKHIRYFCACPSFNLGQNFISSFARHKMFNHGLLEELCSARCVDFIALNYYCKEYVQFKGIIGQECSHSHKERKNYLGWHVYPQGLHKLLISVKKWDLPVFVMENGTAESENLFYEDYLRTHILSVYKALQAGVKVKGYLWWSLLDNFEWDKGFGPRFGLIEVNYQTFERRIKPFAYNYAKICRENKVDI
jgi:beta-glucosidase